MGEPLILAVDQGTTGTTCLLVRPDGTIVRRAYREVPVTYPRPGWVEQDPEDLWISVASAAAEVVTGAESRPVAIGITNQRETVVVVERSTLRPVGPAIVWQCRRSAGICDEHRAAGEEPELRRRTGLLLDPYFTATKIEWLLRERPELLARAERGELLATTVDGWLVARMTGGRAVTVDASNASRTLLYDLRRGDFDPELCAVFGVPPAMLPPVSGSAEQVAITDPYLFLGLHVPISGIAGDQQAALFGQACLRPGMAKNTYGTGSFVLVNAGSEPVPPGHGLLTTVAWRIGGQDTFALEGSIFTTGAALRWLRDGLGLISAYDEVGALAETVPDSGGVHFVPALAGLGAPFWDPEARGAFVGLTAGATRAHLVRAVVESIALRTRDVVEAMEAAGAPAFFELRVDGGASVIDALCRWQADLLGIPVARAATAETTAVGAALLAAVGVGLRSVDDVGDGWRPGARFEPAEPGHRPAGAYAAWRQALGRVTERAGTPPGTDPPTGAAVALDHVQLMMPAGSEGVAEAFYAGLLGLTRVPKPAHLAVRGGCWFENGPLHLHLGADAEFVPARRAHPALVVDDLAALTERLRGAGVEVRAGEGHGDGRTQAYVSDPFGNRIELLSR